MGIVSFVFILVFALVGYSIIRLYLLFKLTALPRIIYWLIQIILTGIMFISAMKINLIKNSVITGIFQFVGALQFIVLIYSSLVFLVRDILCGILKLINRIAKGAGSESILTVFCKKMYSPVFTIVLLAVLLLIAVYGYINMGIIREKTYDITINKTAATDKLSIAMISDLHVGTGIRLSDMDAMVSRVNAMNCDAIVIVGDVVDNNTSEDAYDKMAESFSKFKAEQGVYFTYGNHDGSGGAKLGTALKQAGIRILQDEAVDIMGVSLVGLKDTRWNNSQSSILDTINTSAPVVVLKHQPVGLKNMGKADVVLSGHTHGEQFPFCYLLNVINNDNNYGEKKFGNMISVVSSGIGGWGFHFKFPSNSEIVRLNFSFEK